MNTSYFLNLAAGNLYGTKKTPAIPTKYYIGLSSTAPNASGGGVTEPSSGAAYTRVELTGLSVPTNGVVSNSDNISFPESTSSWGTMTHFVIFDAASGGNLLQYNALDEPRTVERATILLFRAGELKLTVSDPA